MKGFSGRILFVCFLAGCGSGGSAECLAEGSGGVWSVDVERISGDCQDLPDGYQMHPAEDGAAFGYDALLGGGCEQEIADAGSNGDGLHWEQVFTDVAAGQDWVSATMDLRAYHERGGSCSGSYNITLRYQP